MEVNSTPYSELLFERPRHTKDAGMPFESLLLNYVILQACRLRMLTISPTFRPPYVATNIKDPNVSMEPILTTTERCHRDELIMAHMYGLEMLRHRISGHPSTLEDLQEVEVRYPLNAYTKVVLGFRPRFIEPIDDDVSIDPGEAHAEPDLEDDEIENEPQSMLAVSPSCQHSRIEHHDSDFTGFV